jgi:hypothetical protein
MPEERDRLMQVPARPRLPANPTLTVPQGTHTVVTDTNADRSPRPASTKQSHNDGRRIGLLTVLKRRLRGSLSAELSTQSASVVAERLFLPTGDV